MSSLSDAVGEANLFEGVNYSFVPDRFCSAKSAIYFNGGYLQVPNGVYFSGDFTFTAWVYLKSYQSWSRFFEFGNGLGSDNVIFAMVYSTSQLIGMTFDGSSQSYIETSSSTTIINLYEWNFISFVLSNLTGYIYVNGDQVANGILNVPNNITRTKNYIGKSYSPLGSNADAIYDELKIYQDALSSIDIKNEYSNAGILNYCPSNYWPMSNHLNDAVGGANLFEGSSYSFVPDRFCSPNSAIYFNKGYLKVPSGIYFSGNFTFTAWIYLKSYQSWSRIFDFGNGQTSDNVVLSMVDSTSQLTGSLFKGSSRSFIETSSSSSKINLNEWYFISFVLNGTIGYIYVNGDQVATNTLNVPNNITRTSNYIGKSNYDDPNADAIYDELKIYQGALSSADILNEYKKNSKNGNIKLNR
jgi:hypothetical protein